MRNHCHLRTHAMLGSRKRLLSLIGAGLAGLSISTSAAGDREPRQPSIGQLIEQLGHENYQTRLRAKEHLQRLGLEAFDELYAAGDHPDSEIAMTARRLVNSLSVSWAKETDPTQVREVLLEYGAQNASERESRIQRLAEITNHQGLTALTRLARFEQDPRLSRAAALAVMRMPIAEIDAADRDKFSTAILETLQDNDRQAAAWLRVYAADLATGTYSIDLWRDLIQQQRHIIDTASSQQATRQSVLELVRICATRAVDDAHADEAIRLATENIDLIPHFTRDLIDACNWAINNDLHAFVLELQNEHQRMFDGHPGLLYGAAEASLVTGNTQAAEQLAAQALSIKPLPSDAQLRNKLSPKELEEIAQAHRSVGQELESRGLFRWAEHEYRHIIDGLDIDSLPATFARIHLAKMLGEMNDHQGVVAVLDPLCDRIRKDDQFKRRVTLQGISFQNVISDLEYHDGLLHAAQGDIESAKKLLASGFAGNRHNIDILIAMYRLKADEGWMEEVQQELKLEVARAEQTILAAERIKERGAELMLASNLNQYAWLVSNTEGDYQKALRYSLRSLEIQPDDAALMDTCGRCHFAVGNYHEAVRVQRRAVQLMPHSPPITRQLREFEEKVGLSATNPAQ